MFGPSGMKAYTNSVLSILASAKLVLSVPPKYYEHMQFPQARYQARHARYQGRRNNMVKADNKYKYSPQAKYEPRQARNQGMKFNKVQAGSKYKYSVPTHNMFAKLADQGNY